MPFSISLSLSASSWRKSSRGDPCGGAALLHVSVKVCVVMLNQTALQLSRESILLCSMSVSFFSHQCQRDPAEWVKSSKKKKERGRSQSLCGLVRAEGGRERQIGGEGSCSSLSPALIVYRQPCRVSWLAHSAHDRIRSRDVGPTGDLQVLVDKPEPDSLPVQVRTETSIQH